MNRFRLAYFSIILTLFGISASWAQPVQRDHIEVELVSELSRLVPGQPFWVGLRLQPEEHWHTYWRNPGDSGLETRIQWDLPPGAMAGSIQWPYPERVEMAGIINYGYEGEVLLLSQITPPLEPSSSEFNINAKAAWLVCDDVCIPGDAELSLKLPYGQSSQVNAKWVSKIQATKERWPKDLENYQSRFEVSDEYVQLELKSGQLDFSTARQIQYFPLDANVFEYSSPQSIAWDAAKQTVYLKQQKSTYYSQAPKVLNGVIVISSNGGQGGYRVASEPGSVQIESSVFIDNKVQQNGQTFILILLYAFLGGLILNLMPCVFPVLSLKALSLLKQSNHEVRQQQMHGLTYTLGVVLSFIAIAAILLALREAGEKIGWGFQLQIPWFNAVLIFVFFTLALSLSGFIAINMSWAGIGQGLTEKKGYGGSFFTGLLAVLVATPCTAPFMGPAMGYAITQTTGAALMIFTFLGLGMAFPFLLLSYVPKLVNYLPKPGQWMETFKQVMAYPLYLTVVYLIWVLGKQTDINAVGIILLGLVLLAFLAWLFNMIRQGRNLAIASMLMVISGLALLVIFLAITNLGQKNQLANTSNSKPFSVSLLTQLREENKTIFVNLTADWCITCKVNERIALNTDEVKIAFERHNVEYLLGDWTLMNAEISGFLLSFGRTGVPLYLLYSPDSPAPQILPQILTPSTVVEALEKNQ